jgi:signal transduction histidine kinase
MIRYITSRELIYISYCFMQIFSLCFIVIYSNIFWDSKILQDIFLLLATASAIVFSLSFYKGKFFPTIKNTKDLIVNTLLLNIVILTAFYHYMLFEYLPYTVIYAILFISTIFNIKEGNKPILVYVIGWSLFCFILFVLDFKQIYTESGLIDIVLVAFAMEAVLFTISVSYQYTSLKNQKTEYEDMLLQQSRLAKSGEMIGNITHQFRQPLNNISYIMTNIKKRFANQKLDSEYFNKKVNQVDEQLQFLSTTIDHFKEFYTPSKYKKAFYIKEAIDNTIVILSSEFQRRNIELNYQFKIEENIKVEGIKNELSQVLLSILTNASDALKDMEFPKVDIIIDADEAEVKIDIINNGKQIENIHLEKIFDPYFSTKSDGTGIGLYLSKLIMKRSFHGDIKVLNIVEGVQFTLTLERTI